MDAQRLEELRNTAGRCMVCDRVFNELHNIGSLACAQHASELDGDVYPCCGALRYDTPHRFRRGCVAADHNSTDFGTGAMPPRWTHHHDVRLTDKMLQSMPGVKREVVILRSDEGFFRETTVRRFRDPTLVIYAN